MRTISIILVNWNGKTDTITCLDSLRKIRNHDCICSLYVVDNASEDESVSEIQEKFPEVTLVQNTVNAGFSGGVNAGIKAAMKDEASHIWLINNDTTLETNAVSILDAFKGKNVGIVGSKIYFTPGHEYHKNRYRKEEKGRVIWYAGGRIDWNNMYAYHQGVDEVDHGQYDTATETDFVTGCSMMIDKKVIKEIGNFDERYYLYLEDLDYCLRAKRKGFRILFYPISVMWHNNAGSSGGSGSDLQVYYQTRNRYRIGMTYAPLRTKIALLRESLRLFSSGSGVQKTAVIDAWKGKYGKKEFSNK